MATKEQAKKVLDTVVKEFGFYGKTASLFEELVFNAGAFEPCDQERQNGLWSKLQERGLPYATINDALDKWAELLLEV